MITLPDIKALIIDLIGQGVLEVTLRAVFTERSPSLVAGDVDEALLELQRQGVIIGVGEIWYPGHAEVVEYYNP